MEVEDIQQSILTQLASSRYYNIVHFCSVNHTSRKICNERSFWVNLLKLSGLPTTDAHFTHLDEWLSEYHRIKVGYERAVKLADRLQNKELHSDEINRDEINEAGIFVDIRDTPFTSFVVEGVDENQIRFIYNLSASDFYYLTKGKSIYYTDISDIYTANAPTQVKLLYDDGFKVNIEYNDPYDVGKLKNYTYEISKQSMIQLLYNLTSTGVLLADVIGYTIAY